MSQRLKQIKLKLIDGGPREPSPPQQPEHRQGTSRWEYTLLFAAACIIWIAIGYWILKWIFH